MSTYTFSLLLVITSIGYSCQDEVTSPPRTSLYTILISSTPTHSTLPSVPYTSQSSTERTDSTMPQSRLESTSMDMTTKYDTTVTYTSTPENNVSVTFSTTSSYSPSSTSLIPDKTNDTTTDGIEVFTTSIPDTTNDTTPDATEAFTSSIPDTTTDITTNETEASTPGESTPSPQNTDQSTKFQPTTPIISVIPGPVEGQRFYFMIPVCILLIVIILIIFGVYYFKYRPSFITRKASRITKLDLGGLSKQEPIVMRDLKDVVTVLHKDDNLLFSSHYECLSKTAPHHSCSHAEKDKNQTKNRFINVLPFDHSRVILPVKDEDSDSDYINANFLPGFNNSKEYIATQGPLPGTINDFWRMIWENDVTIIVMLTSCKESGRPKCEQYWPIEFDEEMVCGDIKIKNTSSSTINTYTCSILHLTMDSQSEVRVIKHFHYLTWKDMTASIERHDILEFISTIRQNITQQQDGPMVVHCSAGVGRTGTFIVLDYIMQYIQTHDLNNTLDIYGFIMKLRDYRVLIVQSESQYVFIYDCAVDLIEEKRKRLSEILNGHVKEGGESDVAICEDKQRTTSL